MSAPQTVDGMLEGGEAPLPAAILGLLELTIVIQVFVRLGAEKSHGTAICEKRFSLSPNAWKLKRITFKLGGYRLHGHV
jgi:hypothetical protein